MTSPTPPKELSFPDAIKELSTSKITKKEWDNPEIYGFLNDGKLQLHKEDGNHDWIISEADLLGTDWLLTK